MIRTGLALAVLATAGAASAAPVLTPVWQDHAVVQRGKPVVVEGTAAAGATVDGTLGAAKASTTADADGRFALSFPAREASADPVTLNVTDSAGSTTVSDIVVGDVWLCSGQSNMAFTVSAGLSGFGNARTSTDPLLRMMTVPLDTAANPVSEFGGPVEWQKAGPETTGQFSAACYYMLENLRADLGIPMGAIHSSWGGSQIRAWVTPEAGREIYGDEQMALLAQYGRDRQGATSAFAPTWEAWWRDTTGKEPWKDSASLTWQPVPKIGPWNTWDNAPAVVDTVWFRHSIELTADQAAAGGELNIGIIDDLDATWVNGHAVGINHGWSMERKYPIPAEFLHEGTNEIVFAASNSWAEGGMQSAPDRLYFTSTGGTTIPLAEGWEYSDGKVAEQPPRAPWDANAGIGVMHNRMVAPIGHYALKGAAWYQGESDVGLPGYDSKLRELFAGWRGQFGQDAKMLVVQLANYGPTASQPVESGWAEIRQKEVAAVAADPNAALVAALDIGDWRDIHPANKVELGRRLAMAAEGKPMPMPKSATLEGETVTVQFSGVDGGLEAWSGPYPLAVELCGATQESCRWANAAIWGDKWLIPSDGKPATRVRYAWQDGPVVNTYDARDLPVPGFELPIQQ